MNGILITNNPAAGKKNFDKIETIYLENTDLIHVLYFTRNKIHEGHKLLTHPLSGSVKPNQTPYKSIVITKDKAQLDVSSLIIMEDSIAVARKQVDEKQAPAWSREILADFQLIDMDLITSGIESMSQFGKSKL
jgi:hypothetical protein